MAHLLFGVDLSLALSGDGGHGDLHANSGMPISGSVAAKGTGALPHCTQASSGKKTPGLVDYLGVSPVLEIGVGAPMSPSQSCRSHDSVNNPESISGRLTLFYAGTVNVFDNVTADKAQIVLSFAETNNSIHATSSFKMPMAPSRQPSAPHSPQLQDPTKRTLPEIGENLTTTTHISVAERFNVSEDCCVQEVASLLVPCQAVVPTALPIARKASLARFLEKRKERIRLMAPYWAKGNVRDGAYNSNASIAHMFCNEFWGGPAAEKVECASGFPYNNIEDVEDRNWFEYGEELEAGLRM